MKMLSKNNNSWNIYLKTSFYLVAVQCVVVDLAVVEVVVEVAAAAAEVVVDGVVAVVAT